MVQWTKEQEQAIYMDGSDMLVAAAAGSGKTAVLVERIIQKLLKKDDPVDIDSLLVVTFTNAAAQEMRTRVGMALEEALAEAPTSSHLKKQLALLQKASISTLHSFCLDVVRQYAYLLDIDPAFRIANDMEADLIKQEVIDDLFEEWYGTEGKDQASFFSVVDRFSSDRSDVEVEDLVLGLYKFAVQNPWPDQWLDQLARVYEVPEDWQESELYWLSIIKREVKNQLTAMQEEMNLASRLTKESDGPYQYADALDSDLINLQEALARLDSWNELQAFMVGSSFAKLSSKRTDCDEGKKKRVKALRDSYKERWDNMKKNWFSRDLTSHIEDMRELAPVIKQLTELVKQFKLRFTQQKREKALVDFSDLEHFCLQLLIDESATVEETVPSAVANQFKKQFSELLIDEYQDTNMVQETILTLISDQIGPGNRFMVGDVKQSIYRFRHAEPSLFIEKYKRFAREEHVAKRVDLASNFRSREHVLIGANYIFRQILDEELGEINYDADAELIYANKTYDDLPYDEPNPELLIIDREAEEEEGSGGDEDYQDLEKAQLEARAYAEKIKSWIGQKEKPPLQVVDKGTQTQRDMQYRDVVILLRSMSWAPTIVDELKKQSIPVYAELSTGYFEAIEVKIMISLLKVIDNPRQDIPLASVLRSPIVGLNEEDLALIRLADKQHAFYDALKKFKQQNNGTTADKVDAFLKRLEAFRLASRQGALSELIWEIYRETGYYDFVGGMPGGRQRQANLRALYDRARGYETTSFRGLFRFLRFIERMEERGDDLGSARALSEQEDVVRIMTIHKSKGLEFPVVIMGAIDKEFNFQDVRKKYLLHKDLGFASKYIDPVKRITYPTLFYHALKNEKTREMLAEEMRVLYVALTRAKEKLIMVANVPSFEKKQEKWQKMIDHTEWVLPAHYRMESKTYLDWVGPALIRHKKNSALRTEEINDAVLDEIQVDPSEWDVKIIHGSELTNLEETTEDAELQLNETITKWEPVDVYDEVLDQTVNDRLSFEYPFEEAARSRAKQTVTEIKRQREVKDEYSADQLVQTFQAPIVKRPNFMQKEKRITSAEKGTAMHTVMQHLPMVKPLNQAEIEENVEALVEKEVITKQEADIVNVAAIEEFFSTSIATLMMGVPAINREVPFSLSLPASEVYASWTGQKDENVLIQGVIDCIIPQDDGWIIIDYKTDAINEAVTDKTKEKLAKKYGTQMELYRDAVEQIWKQPVKATYLYFFDSQLVINVPLNE
ncbi:ATP-dependent helicase/nuclease subunit A [Virgibacillus natechei]|uniref:ATP-dependent helicase/nuclease subunit A n=1 Tax=Virgibacillus natechei TaxID=1216297 RepID=A0ABS4IDI5_9BACI|nr:helicase-exonuclease AddAB subunit AddA [Virgibacillus natechei]MBP1969007.1 ATP-dependent helicase/nuclease subunit A [Virgibacillus natechei]UZD14283.1 helicase-exonuclease AddAB subunit AddA [Virgibacillus natechei]